MFFNEALDNSCSYHKTSLRLINVFLNHSKLRDTKPTIGHHPAVYKSRNNMELTHTCGIKPTEPGIQATTYVCVCVGIFHQILI